MCQAGVGKSKQQKASHQSKQRCVSNYSTVWVSFNPQVQNLNACHVKIADKELKYEIIMKHTHF